MKKHIVCFHLYNDYSGSPRVLQVVLQGLLRRGYSVDLLTSRGCAGALDALDGMSGLRKSTYYYKFNDRNLLLSFLNFLWAQVYMFFYALRYTSRKDVVFYVNTIMPCGAALAGRLIGKKVVCHYHENAFAKGPFYKVNAWIMTKLAHEIVFVSAYQASYIKRKYGVTVIPNALPKEFVDKLHPDIDAAFERKNVLMLSSLKDYKGTKEFIRIASEMPQYKFTLVISDTRESIDRYLTENNITAPANLDVFSRQSDVTAFYNNASIVVNLTDKEKVIETFGMTALESMKAGLPVIVPTEGGIADLVDGTNGYKIDVRDLDAVEDAISRMLSDKAHYSALAAGALEKSKPYDAEVMIPRMEFILNDKPNDLFLELIRASIGVPGGLSRTPDGPEWSWMYNMAHKQSVGGICLAGIYNPSLKDLSESQLRQTPTKKLYKTWVAASAKIQMRNEQHEQLLKAISDLLKEKGYRVIFMKGLTCSTRYPEPSLRQSGDIDFVVRREDFKGVMKALEEIAEVDHELLHEYHGIARIDNVLLEPHYKIHNFQNPLLDRTMLRLQDDLLNRPERCMIRIGVAEIEKLPPEFEGVFLLSHMVNHVFADGLGLRQVLDFGMWVKDVSSRKDFDMDLYNEYLRKLRMKRASRLFTCVCEQSFGIDGSVMGYVYTDREKQFAKKMIDDVLNVGTFARAVKNRLKPGWVAYKWTAVRTWRLGYLCPSEARWWPVSKLVRFFDKKLNSTKYKH